jgi:hypothetical protein
MKKTWEKRRDTTQIQSNHYFSGNKLVGITDISGDTTFPSGYGCCLLCQAQNQFFSFDDAEHWMDNHLDDCLEKNFV